MKKQYQRKSLVLGVGPLLGLGAALCQRFANEGHHVFVGGRTRSKIEEVVRDIEAKGGSATPVLCDATVESDVARMFAEADAYGDGPLELAVFNVGNSMPGKVREMTSAYFEEAWRVGCYSGFLFGREAVKTMLPLGGTVIFTGASASLRGKANFSAFNAAKSGLRSFAQALSKEHGSDGLHVGHVIIDGGIAGERQFSRSKALLENQERLISLDGLTDAYWYLHQQSQQAWTFEVDVRTAVEDW
ncbi:MAG: SDR family NAD(P)-dependent oxidoreductase [Gammaproteobacteria bacterium]|nr:SDR family NAD(P)-dependent oxidoreductase [Gammaproteobacteria bacterium]